MKAPKHRGMSVTVSHTTHHVLTLAAVNAGPRIGRRVTLNEVMAAAIRVADGHRDELDRMLLDDASGES